MLTFYMAFNWTVDWILASSVVGGVYYILRWRKQTKENQEFESILEDIEDEGLTVRSCLKIVSSAVKLGGYIAGTAELGFFLAPKDLGIVSVFQDIFRLIGDLYDSGPAPRRPTLVARPLSDRSGLGSWTSPGTEYYEPNIDYVPRDPGESIESYRERTTSNQRLESELNPNKNMPPEAKAINFIRRIKVFCAELWTNYKVRATLIVLSSVLGAVLFIFMHHRPTFDFVREGRKGKGNIMGGKRRMRKQRKYIVYDSDRIEDMTRDGVKVNPTTFGEEELPPGRYTISRRDVNGNLYFEEFEIEKTGQNDPDYEKLLLPGDPIPPLTDSGDLFEELRVAHNVISSQNDRLNTLIEKMQQEQAAWLAAFNLMADAGKIPRESLIKLNLFSTKTTLIDDNSKYSTEYTTIVPPRGEDDDETPLTKGKKVTIVVPPPAWPKEAVVTSSPELKFEKVRSHQVEMFKDDSFVQMGWVAPYGIVCNTHSIGEINRLRYQGKFFELHRDSKTGALVQRKLPEGVDPDLVVLKSIDGLCPVTKGAFCKPVVGMACHLVANVGELTAGFVTLVTDTEVQYSCTSRAGWCGGMLVNNNGQIMASHSRAHKKDAENAGINIGGSSELCSKLMNVAPKNS